MNNNSQSNSSDNSNFSITEITNTQPIDELNLQTSFGLISNSSRRNQSWWDSLAIKKKIVFGAIALSFSSAAIAGGSSYYFANHLSSLLIGSGLVATMAGAIAALLSKKPLREIYGVKVVDSSRLDRLLKDTKLGELEVLGENLKQLSGQLQTLTAEQTRINQQRQLFSSMTFRTRQTTNIDLLLQIAVDGAREILATDRVVVYRFNDDRTGTVVAESVASGLPKALAEGISDRCFQESYLTKDQVGKIRAINDIYQEPGLTNCYIRLLEQYQVKASLVVPIRQQDKMMGLLIAHHCRTPRIWEKVDLDFCNQIATEIEYGLDYIHFVQNHQQANDITWFFGNIIFSAHQSLDLDDVFQVTVDGARDILQTDRVVIYRFNYDWSGTIVAESVAEDYPSILVETIDDPCFRGSYVDLYKNGRVRAINNLRSEPGLNACHIRTLEKYGVKANLVVPLRKDNQLIGLLIAHNCAAPRIWQQSEIDFFTQLGTQVEYAIDYINATEKIQATTVAAKLFGDIAFRARQSLKQQDIFRITVQGARQALKADRVVIYKFNPDSSGTIIAESVVEGGIKMLDINFDDPFFQETYLESARRHRARAINDIYSEPEMSDFYLRTLEQYDVKANLIVPIRQEHKLFALLIAHQCSAPRAWQKAEQDFLTELATQTEYALDYVSFIDKLETARQKAETASQEKTRQTEVIKNQLTVLVEDIKDLFTGNLTVRAQVMKGEIGTVAKFLNNTLENLQKIVLKTQSNSDEVIQVIQSSEGNINSLAHDALQQAESITHALGQIQRIAESIHGVADNAQSAKKMVQQANQSLEDGDLIMNRTVDGIMAIQETVEETAQKVKRLGEASQKISRVVNLIRDLASQTHVLALNASIEANGTSGEGQGFAVVAEEVRSLSEQSTTATKEIEQILEEIQTEANQVAIAMEAGREQVIAGTELVETTRQKLTSIAQVSGKVRYLVEDMANAATVQAQTSMSVSQTMQEVETIAQQTSAKSLASVESFNKLLEVAQQLQASITKFTVD
ncbi:MAG: GAF domain-containing protein [Xenococcus sp. MO_188.B8]|nr:GAF domain-containing protein [Xenococcus sp. MO_188.B8]